MSRARSKGYNDELTREFLVSLLHYDELTGVFTWRSNRPKVRAGDVAGTRSSHDYWQISIRDKVYSAHRLAWFYVHGTWPSRVIDHIDGDRMNNRIDNLRDVSTKENINGFRRVPIGWTWRFSRPYHF